LTERKTQSKEGILSVLTGYFRTRYKFSSVIARALAQDVLRLTRILSPDSLKEGQVLRYVVKNTEPPGKLLRDCQFVLVKLTLHTPEDVEYRKCNGLKELKLRVIQRITQEAIAQGGSLSQEDIADLLFLDRRTVVDYVKELESRGVQIITRAKFPLLFNQAVDKTQMIKMFLEGLDEAEIASNTCLSENLVRRYVEEFLRIGLFYRRGITASAIATVTGIDLKLVEEYVELYNYLTSTQMASYIHKFFSFYEDPVLLKILKDKEQFFFKYGMW